MKLDNAMMRRLQNKSAQGKMEVQTSAATHKGIGLKSLYFGLVTILAAVISYVMFYKFLDTGNGEALYVLLMIASFSFIPMLVLSVIISFAPKTVVVCGTLYSLLQGLFLSVLVALVDMAYPGIFLAAVLGTLIVFCVALLFSRVFGAKVSSKLLLGLYIVIVALALTELVLWVLSLCGVYAFGAIWWIQLISCAFCIVMGTIMLMADFQTAESMVNQGVDKSYEWNVGFAIVTTLVYLYLEILELLIRIAMIFGRKKN